MSTFLKPFGIIFFGLVIYWVGWIFVSYDRDMRIMRTCAPIDIVGKFTESVAGIFSMSAADTVNDIKESSISNCKTVVWKQFFDGTPDLSNEDALNKMKIEKRLNELKALREQIIRDQAGASK